MRAISSFRCRRLVFFHAWAIFLRPLTVLCKDVKRCAKMCRYVQACAGLFGESCKNARFHELGGGLLSGHLLMGGMCCKLVSSCMPPRWAPQQIRVTTARVQGAQHASNIR